MKNTFLIIVSAFALFAFTFDGGGTKKKETFTVYGNCGMCEKVIEGALADVEGVMWADWEVESLELTVKYDEAVISLDQIKQIIADVGYDSDSHRAEDSVYENLHACCKYDRPKKK